MRTCLLVLGLALVVVAPSAVEARGALNEYRPRSGPGTLQPARPPGTLGAYGKAGTPKDPDRFPWAVVALPVFLGIAALFARRMFQSSKEILDAHATVGRNPAAAASLAEDAVSARPASRQPAARPSAPPAAASPDPVRDTVLAAVAGTEQAVTAEVIANRAGLDAATAAQVLEGLASEGLVERSRDRFGRDVYRAGAA